MRVLSSFSFTVFPVVALLTGGAAATGYTDKCAQVNQVLKVPQPLIPGSMLSVGTINACLCISDIPSFITTSAVAISGVALAGRTYVINAITNMIQPIGQTCNYPDHAVAQCTKSSPCGFTCKDGYTPFPSAKPTQCVCNKPNTECNGKCGNYYACPSGHSYPKRDMLSRDRLCPKGMEACGILGRNARTWECVDTLSDLESCGGCIIPLPGRHGLEGEDCTAIPGVSDVSCVSGKCIVHKCEDGFDFEGGECVYNEDKDPIILAAQYGLENM